MSSLYNFIVASAESAVKLQLANGSFFPGVNGPYNQQETPVRVTAHWLMVLLKSCEITSDRKYLDYAKKALDYLLLPMHRPYGKTYVCRDLPNLDKANGLIGQAWVIEALCMAYRVLEDERAINVAYELFEMHPFHKRAGLWEIVDADGSRFRTVIDLVINHQIWFAAAGSELLQFRGFEDYPSVKEKIRIFLDRLPKNLGLNTDATYRHNILPGRWLFNLSPVSFIKTTKVYGLLKSIIKGSSLGLSEGYHAFHNYGLAMLMQNYKDHSVWNSRLIHDGVLQQINHQSMIRLETNKYGLHYNPPGLETAFSLEVFKPFKNEKNIALINQWLTWQFIMTWNDDDGMMSRVHYDPVTYSSRIYEAVRLSNFSLNHEI